LTLFNGDEIKHNAVDGHKGNKEITMLLDGQMGKYKE